MTKKITIHTVGSNGARLPNVRSWTQEGVRKETPEDYISARHLRKELDISATTARTWRIRGKIRAKKVGSTWSYSRQDLSKLLQKMYPITIDGKHAKLRDVKASVRDSVLKEALGDYISGKDIHHKVGIVYETLRNWRKSGKVRATKIGATWYYSKSDMMGLITTPKDSV